MKKGPSFVSMVVFDFVSRPVGLNVRGKSTVHTKLGAIFSIVCLALYATLSWVTITNYLDTSRPVISYESQSTKHKEKIDVKKSKLYPILFFFDQVNYLSIDEVYQYVNPYILYYRKPSVGAAVTTRLKLVPCKELVARGKTDTITADSEGFVKANYEKLGLCVDDEGNQVTLGGAEVSDDFELFRVLLYPCTRTDGTCKTQTQLAKLALSVSFPTPQTNFGDYKSPVRYVTESNEFVGVSNMISVVNYHSLRVNEVVQERGFLSKLQTTHHFVSIDKSTSQIRTRDATQITCSETALSACTPYIIHNVIMTNNKMKIQRSYKGIVESISEIGGMIDLIYLIFMILHSAYHGHVIKNFFIKEVYGVDKPASSKPRCCRKKNREVSSGQFESEAEQRELYNKATERLNKDLDMVKILQELNIIKYFLITNCGLTTGSELSTSKTLKELENFDHKKKEEVKSDKEAMKVSQMMLHRSSLKIQHVAPTKKDLGDPNFFKAAPVPASFSAGVKQQPSIKPKKSLFSSSKISGYATVEKPLQEAGDFSSQLHHQQQPANVEFQNFE